ncbi:MAG: metal ABC transporter permease [Candidatus Hydrothermota bacterium]|nr:MAG: metal ABC transporter permease [Candidatus Hydrothermae bacterium]
MPEILKLGIIQRALFASLLVGLLLPLSGSFAVVRKSAFLGAGVAHIAFSGVAFGLMISSPPILWAFIFSVLASVLIWHGGKSKRMDYDLSIGILFSLAMALGILFLGISKKYGSEALGYLFGNILTTTKGDLYTLGFLLFLLLLFYLAFYKELFFMSFNEELAEASGINVSLFSLLLLLSMTFSVVASLKAVGALLVFGLLVMPAAAAYQLTYDFKKMIALSLLFGLISSVGGIAFSIFIDVPSGATVVILAFVIFLLAFLFSRKKSG